MMTSYTSTIDDQDAALIEDWFGAAPHRRNRTKRTLARVAVAADYRECHWCGDSVIPAHIWASGYRQDGFVKGGPFGLCATCYGKQYRGN